MFEYMEKNLNEIMQNQDNVMYLRPYDIGNKRALFAVVKKDQGVYKKVQITKEQSKMSFPFEPIVYFYNGPGYFLLKDFIAFHNNLALNIKHLDGFGWKKLKNDKFFKIGVFATFSDGSATYIVRNTKREFNKKGGLQFYIDELKKYKDCDHQHETYQVIECFSTDDDTFAISELQQEKSDDVHPTVVKPSEEEIIKGIEDGMSINDESGLELAKRTSEHIQKKFGIEEEQKDNFKNYSCGKAGIRIDYTGKIISAHDLETIMWTDLNININEQVVGLSIEQFKELYVKNCTDKNSIPSFNEKVISQYNDANNESKVKKITKNKSLVKNHENS